MKLKYIFTFVVCVMVGVVIGSVIIWLITRPARAEAASLRGQYEQVSAAARAVCGIQWVIAETPESERAPLRVQLAERVAAYEDEAGEYNQLLQATLSRECAVDNDQCGLRAPGLWSAIEQHCGHGDYEDDNGR